MNLTAEQLQQNYTKFLGYIDKYITGERKKKLLELYNDHAERIMLMPASTVDHHHNTWPGGYVDHVMRVIDCALDLKALWTKWDSTIDYTDEELVFAAMNHDLGKIGTEEAEQYITNDSEWHRKNLGKIYKYNTVNPFMTVPDRSLFLLQQRGIPVSFNEYLGIKLHDGLYDENNKAYFISRDKDSKLRTNLPILLHHADSMAARIEYESWNKDQHQPIKEKRKPNIPTSMNESQKEELINVFNDLFK
jgi:hypothetical protein